MSIRNKVNPYNSYWKFHKSQILDDFNYKWPTIIKLIPKNKEIRILDHGCGTGIIFQRLIKLNPKSTFFGVDISEYAIKTIKKRFPKYNFYNVGDNGKLPIKRNSVDLIISLDVIEHITATRDILSEFNRILKPDGELILSTPYHGVIKNLVLSIIGFEKVFDPYGPHIRFFTKKSLTQGLDQAGFKIKKFGVFGRFFPLSRGMFVVAQKQNKELKLTNNQYT
jgi:2-polyprenyl-3-methyl-5-hydroxy-6-metoxy-1,4-benzoquinol methylase